ncbi:hypothetical protein ACQW02_12645 [Humitalea sp. 24SJ18S-53]|uniref:hypothetical protein n=1 Tax=Humitalea sp. 24SJ18S-53 TaxID=3422307 RepID=UPI003D675E5C
MSTPASRQPITAETVDLLSDDEVLVLLENHAMRVIHGDAKLMPPGKISLMPIVAGKLRHRAEANALLDTLAAESLWLTTWIESKIQLHQTPSQGTISKVLGSEYKALKARSNAAIQNLKD